MNRHILAGFNGLVFGSVLFFIYKVYGLDPALFWLAFVVGTNLSYLNAKINNKS